jgi:hypothetical protein
MTADPLPSLDVPDQCTADATGGTGEFTIDLTGLASGGTTYYVRAYATNGNGTAYADSVETFDTLCMPGDVNGDNQVTLDDAILALQILVNEEDISDICLSADVNGDNKIGIDEVIYILRQVLEG